MKRLIALILVLAVGFYVGWPAWSGYQIKSALDRSDAATLRQKIDFPSVRESLRPAAAFHAEQMIDNALRSSNSPVTTVLNDQAKATMTKNIVSVTLDRVVTPENIIRIAKQGGTVKDAVAQIVREQMGSALGGLGNLSNLGKVRIGDDDGNRRGTELDIGGLVGGIVGAATGARKSELGGLISGLGEAPKDSQPEARAPEPQTAAASPKKEQRVGLDNIKSVGFTGPLGLQIGVAQSPSAKKPDLVAEMGFRDLDWKLVALRPTF